MKKIYKTGLMLLFLLISITAVVSSDVLVSSERKIADTIIKEELKIDTDEKLIEIRNTEGFIALETEIMNKYKQMIHAEIRKCLLSENYEQIKDCALALETTNKKYQPIKPVEPIIKG